MYVATHKSKDALLALSFFLGMALVVFSTLIYFAERGTWDANLGTFVNADGMFFFGGAAWIARKETLMK
jgi:potassium voltage-gated channel Shal-related subfamily D member 2